MKSFLILIICAWSNLTAIAQGSVIFNNNPSTLVGWGPWGHPSPISGAAGSFYFALLTSTSGAANTFTFAGIYATNSATAPGRFIGGTQTVSGWAPGTTMFYEVAGWSANLGVTWNPAWLQNVGSFVDNSFFGISESASGTAGGGNTLFPAFPLFGGTGILGNFNLYPAAFTYATNNGTIVITSYIGLLNDVIIPGTINGMPVASIGSNAFASSAALRSVTIPNSVISIGDSAFAYSGLTSIIIPDSVTSMGISTFNGCQGLTNVTLGNGLTNIGAYTFSDCVSLNNIIIPSSVTSIGLQAFANCSSPSFNSITIPHSVTSIGDGAFQFCMFLKSVTIPGSVTNIPFQAFGYCSNLINVYCLGNAPAVDSSAFVGDDQATVYYLQGTTGWGPTFGGLPVAPLVQVLQTSLQTQTAEATSTIDLSIRVRSPLPLFFQWYLNYTGLLSGSTNSELELTNLQFAQSGAYTLVVSNALGAITSAPALLQVIAPVERRPVPGLKVTGDSASLLNVDSADSLNANWTKLGSVSLTGTSQYYFDLTLPLTTERFYRVWQERQA